MFTTGFFRAGVVLLALAVPGVCPVSTAIAGEPGCVLTPLVTFKDALSRNGWKANAWGGGRAEVVVRDSMGDRFTWHLRMNCIKTRATLSNAGLFAALRRSMRSRPITGFYLYYRTSGFDGTINMSYMCRKDGGTFAYLNSLGIKQDGKWHLLRVPLGGWNREKHLFRLDELAEIHWIFRGTGEFRIGEIGLLCSYRELPGILGPALKGMPVPRMRAFVINGEISGQESGDSATVTLSLPDRDDSRHCSVSLPQDATRVFVGWTAKGIYCAARCFKNDMRKLKADFTENAERIWQDECVEFYFDPNRSMLPKRMKKYAINANGRIGIANIRDRHAIPETAARKYDDRWEVEMFLPWTALGIKPAIPFALGFNATRTTYDNNKLSERMGWTTPVWNATKDFGILFVTAAGKSDRAVGDGDCLLEYAGRGKYVIRGAGIAKGARYKFTLCSPSGELLRSGNGVLKDGKRELSFRFPVARSGYYPFGLLIHDGQGRVMDYAEGRISEQAPADWKALPVDHPALFPEPKQFELRSGFFGIRPGMKYDVVDDGLEFCGRTLCAELKRFYNISLEKSADPAAAEFILDLNLTSPAARMMVKANKLEADFAKIKHDGFMLFVSTDRILITAKEKRGILYGVNALLDLVKMTTGEVGEARVRAVKVVDYPDFGHRFWFHHMRGFIPAHKYDPVLYQLMLARIPLHFRYNGFFLELDDLYQWECAPVFGRNPRALCREEVRGMFDFIRAHYVPVMPALQSLGHMAWLLEKKEYQYLREDDDRQTLCTGNPDSYKVLFGFYDELLKLCSEDPHYQPRYFVVQLDEVRWKTRATPEKKRCKYCRGIPKRDIYLAHIKKIAEYMKHRNVRPIMWSDMLMEEHNGLNEFKCVEIRDRIPRSMIMGHWSLVDYPGIPRFRKLGFENWKTATGYHVSRLHENMISGQMFLIWTYYWWLSHTRCGSQGSYGPMAQALYANACWNTFPDSDNSSWMKYTRQYGNWLMHNWSRKPLPGAGAGFHCLDITGIVNDLVIDKQAGDGKGWFDYGDLRDLSLLDLRKRDTHNVPFRFAGQGADIAFLKFSAQQQAAVTLKVSKRVGSLILLHAADLRDRDLKEFRARKNYGDPLRGKPVAKYTVIYADGSSAEFRILFGWNIATWTYNPMRPADVFAKYVIDARAIVEGRTRFAVSRNLPEDVALYQYEWPNPRPGTEIESIRIESLGTRVAYGLLAVTARKAKAVSAHR